MRNILVNRHAPGSILTKESVDGKDICVCWDNYHYTWAEEEEGYKEFRCEEHRVYLAGKTGWYYLDSEQLSAHLRALLYFLQERGLVFVDYTRVISDTASQSPSWFNIERMPGSILNKITLCKKECEE